MTINLVKKEEEQEEEGKKEGKKRKYFEAKMIQLVVFWNKIQNTHKVKKNADFYNGTTQNLRSFSATPPPPL